jgi:hypothetical protein
MGIRGYAKRLKEEKEVKGEDATRLKEEKVVKDVPDEFKDLLPSFFSFNLLVLQSS